MTFGTKYTNGDIVLLPVPFTNLQETKVRPAFVITQIQDDIIVCGITSVLRNHPYVINIKDLESSTLPKQSQIHCTMIATLEKSLVFNKIGHATSKTKSDVRQLLIQLLTTKL